MASKTSNSATVKPPSKPSKPIKQLTFRNDSWADASEEEDKAKANAAKANNENKSNTLSAEADQQLKKFEQETNKLAELSKLCEEAKKAVTSVAPGFMPKPGKENQQMNERKKIADNEQKKAAELMEQLTKQREMLEQKKKELEERKKTMRSAANSESKASNANSESKASNANSENDGFTTIKSRKQENEDRRKRSMQTEINKNKMFKTQLCRDYTKGECKRFNCKFAHGDKELRTVTN